MSSSKVKNYFSFKRVPHAVTMLFGIIVLITILTYILPAGLYERELINGRNTVIPNSYHTIDSTPVGFLSMFTSIPLGFKTAAEVIFIVLAGAIMFGFMEKSKAVENSIGVLVKKMGSRNKEMVIIIMTFVYGLLGIAVGYENNIAMVPIAAVLSIALGGDLILAAGIAVGGMTIGFGLSPINPYTVGTGHKIAELPIFSGALLRSVFCLTALSIMAFYNVRYFRKIVSDPNKSLGKGLNTSNLTLSKPIQDYQMSLQNWLILAVFLSGLVVIVYGVFNLEWYINQLSAVFIIVSIVCGLIARMSATEMSETVLKSVAAAAPAAFLVGLATSIKVLMEMGNIGDTISHQLSILLEGLPLYASAICMSVAQSAINFFIPSGSGQALATLPVMLPLGESLGLTRQITILAFQIGDGLSNLINPTLAGLVGMLSMCRVPIGRWIRFIFPVFLTLIGLSFITLIIAVAINYS